MLKKTTSLFCSGIFVTAFLTLTPTAAIAQAGSDIGECLALCRQSASMTDPSWASTYMAMCTDNCITKFDGGTGGGGGGGTTPIYDGYPGVPAHSCMQPTKTCPDKF